MLPSSGNEFSPLSYRGETLAKQQQQSQQSQLHINDLGSTPKKSTTTTTTQSGLKPSLVKSRNSTTASSMGLPQSPKSNIGEVILEELVTDDSDYDNSNGQSNLPNTPLTPNRSQSKTPRRWRLVPANCTCLIHENNNTSNFCPNCSKSQTQSQTQTNNNNNNNNSNKSNNLNSNFESTYDYNRTSTSKTNNGSVNNNMFNEYSNNKSNVTFQSPLKKVDYNVISSGNFEKELLLLKHEVGELEDEFGLLKNSSVNKRSTPITHVHHMHSPIYDSNPFNTTTTRVSASSPVRSPSSLSASYSSQQRSQPPPQQPPIYQPQFNTPINTPSTSTTTTNTTSSTNNNGKNLTLLEQIKNLIDDLEREKNQKNQIKRERDEFERLYKEINRLLNEKEMDINQLRKQNQHIEQQLQQDKQTSIQLLEQLGLYQNELSENASDLELLKELQMEIGTIKNRYNEKNSELAEKNNLILQNEIEIQKLSTAITKIKLDKSNQEKSEQLLKEIKQLQKQIQDNEKQYNDKLQFECSRHNSTIESMKQNQQQYNQTIARLETIIAQREKQIDLLINEKQGKILVDKLEFEQINQEMDVAFKKANQFDHDNQVLLDENEQLSTINNNLKNDLAQSMDSNQELQQYIKKLLSENNDMKERLSKVHYIVQDSPKKQIISNTQLDHLLYTPKSPFINYKSSINNNNNSKSDGTTTTTTTTTNNNNNINKTPMSNHKSGNNNSINGNSSIKTLNFNDQQPSVESIIGSVLSEHSTLSNDGPLTPITPMSLPKLNGKLNNNNHYHHHHHNNQHDNNNHQNNNDNDNEIEVESLKNEIIYDDEEQQYQDEKIDEDNILSEEEYQNYINGENNYNNNHHQEKEDEQEEEEQEEQEQDEKQEWNSFNSLSKSRSSNNSFNRRRDEDDKENDITLDNIEYFNDKDFEVGDQQ